MSNSLIEVEENEDKSNKLRLSEKDVEKQSNKILQNILQASKLFEGRFNYNDIANLDIPNFEALVDNEFANIDKSYKNFKEKGIINAYTRGEKYSSDEDLKILNDTTSALVANN